MHIDLLQENFLAAHKAKQVAKRRGRSVRRRGGTSSGCGGEANRTRRTRERG
jgi:hypothetical protein